MNAQTSKRTDEPMITFEFVGPGETPTRVSPGNGEVYLVDDHGRFEAPARFAQGLGYLGFRTLGEASVKASGESHMGIGAHMGQDRSKKA